jgi:hypothetical protein
MRLGKWHRAGIILTAVLIAIPSYLSSKEAFFSLGEGPSSCGEFLRSADAERKRRPANASPTDIYDINFGAFTAYAEGFLTGSNYSDPIEGGVGEHTDQNGRMAWLENYCRGHPLDTYVKALMELRKFLLK